MAEAEVERLKSELAAVKGRAVTKIKQQAQQIAEQQQQIAELKAQLVEKATTGEATPSNSSEEGDKERFVKVARADGVGDLDESLRRREEELRRREEELRRREEALPAREQDLGQPETEPCRKPPVWHAALLHGLQTIQQNLVL